MKKLTSLWLITIAIWIGTTQRYVNAKTVALWLFDDPVGSKVAMDCTGHGYDLTIGSGAAIVKDGKHGNALDADAGPSGAMGAYRNRIPAELNPDGTSWTLECWIKPKPGMKADNRIWGISGVNYIDLGRGSDNGLFVADHFLPVGGRWNWPTGQLEQDQHWHHVAFVYDAKVQQIRYYLDGKKMFAGPCRWKAVEFDPKLAAVFPPQYPQLQIGMRDPIQQWDYHELHAAAAPRKRFQGYIDEMRFSDEALYDADFTPPATFAGEFPPLKRPTGYIPPTPADEARVRQTAIDVHSRRELFIDHRFIESSQNVRLVQNAPEHVLFDFPTLPGEAPLAPNNIVYLKEEKKWRMYYASLGKSSTHYMESTDGLHWARPTGDNTVVYGEKHTPLGIMTGIMLDSRDEPGRRFKAFQDIYSDDANVRGVYAYYSADGIHFTQAGRVLPMCAEMAVIPLYDARIGKYVVFMRVMNVRGGDKMIQGNQFVYHPDGSVDAVEQGTLVKPGYENIRAIGRIETDNLLKPWPYNHSADPTLYTTAENIPMVLCADPEDGFVDFYQIQTWHYPFADDVYLAFPSAFRHMHPSREPDRYRYDDANGLVEMQLATSRDGIHWNRQQRQAYVSMGLTDQPDRWLNAMGVGGVRNGDWIYQYYWSPALMHDGVLLRPDAYPNLGGHGGKLFALRQRLDGFVSADTDYHGGWLLTPPIVFSGRRLLLNQNCNATGTIYVELRDANNVPIPGYSLGECEEVAGNDTGWEIRWRDHEADVSALAGKPVRIYFQMRSAKLYAFEFSQ
ncbi:MAG TPA: LamG domain-containing protein [Tepidisphaeraceae bacterium]|nr:LamG domain-containing protein [Tepidisphaeraceae bacterium]